ncbi:cytochrome b5 [Saitoella complicata NRRL Y-17804]|nr:cytochrome b5 [Saitoella complicata NRRL Y-17804]ODQ55798.1 cytochrome b5 [Saitoella complicata NRRL Y-17804]
MGWIQAAVSIYTQPVASLPLANRDADVNGLFIPPDEVVKHTSAEAGGIWLVIEDSVYDVTDFLTAHPGGPEILENFGGQNCTWQFWKFHNKSHLAEWSERLRIGWTNPPTPKYLPPRNLMAKCI